MDPKIFERKRALKADLIGQIKVILDLADKERRGLTRQEQREYDGLSSELDGIVAELQDEEKSLIRAGQAERAIRQLRGPIKPDPSYRPGEIRGREIGEVSMYDGKNIESRYAAWLDKHEYRHDPKGSGTRDAFNRFLAKGPHALAPEEYRALQMDSDAAGGFLVAPVEVAATVLVGLDNAVFVRQYATVWPLRNAHSLGVPAVDGDFGDLEWTTELSSGSADSSLTLGRRDLFPHPVARRIKVSNKLLRNGGQNPETIVRQRMTFKLGAVQENAFLNGNGAGRPLGVFTASADGIDTSRDVSDGNTTTTIKADGIINAVGALKAQYRKRARWIMHRDVETQVRKLKDGNGDYLWRAGLAEGMPNTLLGFPVMLSEYAPNTFTSGSYLAILGDFSFYWIADSLEMMIKRADELYLETDETGFFIRAESDGMPVDPAAFVRVKLA